MSFLKQNDLQNPGQYEAATKVTLLLCVLYGVIMAHFIVYSGMRASPAVCNFL